MTILQQAHSAFQRGDDARAMQLANDLLRQQADLEPALTVLANAALRSGQLDIGLQALQRLRQLRPDHPGYARILSQTWNRKGSAERRQQQDAAAEASFRSALAAWPDNRDALFNLALLLQARGRDDQALSLWQRVAALAPQDVEANLELAYSLCRNQFSAQARERLLAMPAQQLPATVEIGLRLSEVLMTADLPERCADALETLDLRAEHHDRVFRLAEYLARAGCIDAARRCFLHCHDLMDEGRRSPGLRDRIAASLVLPVVHADDAAIDTERERFAIELERLQEALSPTHLAQCEPGLAQLAWANFYLAYQGRNDRSLQARYGDLLARCAPLLLREALPAPKGSGRGRRIGLVSSFFRHCTVGHYFASWPRLLADAGFEVLVFQLGPLQDEFTRELAQPAARLAVIDGGAEALVQQLQQAQCDLLIYPELGMDYRMPAVAALRLAPRQACAWGHPVSSGLPTMDAYFSCAAMEPNDASAHYREPLRLLPGLGTLYPPPPQPPPASRGALSLPETGHLYLVPHSLFKLHPDNDAVLATVAADDPDAVLVLFLGEGEGISGRFRPRLEAALRAAGAEPDRQLRFLPMSTRERFLQINRACSVMVDSLHWSGGNTSIDALASGLPVITCPGRYMRSRQSAAMLRHLGLDELVVDSPAELAPLAIELAHDSARRAEIAARIHSGLPSLLDCADLGEALVGHVEELLANAGSATIAG